MPEDRLFDLNAMGDRGVELAQLAGSSEAAGRIETLSGIVNVQRANGEMAVLREGDAIFMGDNLDVADGASVGLIFADDTTVALGSGAQMLIDEMVYDPAGESGSLSLSIAEGVFSFVSGQIAKTQDEAMVLNTPVATIGIRGTQGAGVAAPEGSQNQITLMPEADGHLGEIVVRNDAGVQVLNQPNQSLAMTSRFEAPPPPVVMSAEQIQQAYGTALSVMPAPPKRKTDGENGAEGEGEDTAETAEEAIEEEAVEEGEVEAEAGTEEASEEFVEGEEEKLPPEEAPEPMFAETGGALGAPIVGGEGEAELIGGAGHDGLGPDGFVTAGDTFDFGEFVLSEPFDLLPPPPPDEGDTSKETTPAPTSPPPAVPVVSGDVFLQGTYLELGIAEAGSLGTTDAAPDAFHNSTYSNLSMLADEDGFDSGEAVSEDYFLPGTPTEGFVLTHSGLATPLKNIAREGHSDIAMETFNTSGGTTLSATSSGSTDFAEISQVISYDKDATFFTTEVTITNTSGGTLSGLRYMRIADPDQDSSTMTDNDVLNNPTNPGPAAVIAKGAMTGDHVGFLSEDANARTSATSWQYDPNNAAVYDTPTDPDGASGDLTIHMTFEETSLAAGASVTFTFYTSISEATAGHDLLMGSNGADNMTSAAGNDRLYGFDGVDVLDGGTGNDMLWGGAGNDQLTGGSGTDKFHFIASQGTDTITDFTTSEDVISIDKASYGITSINYEVIATAYDGTNATTGSNVIQDSNGDIWVDTNDTAAGGYSIVTSVGAGTTVTASDVELSE
ncbi:hypothetical protein [Terasakiella sp. SH-1]|uniref:hypothetical protein n=1 Tax=Terasakiella sp. SH-1 TaxID=2560057 RepID=UPI001073784A|nr:hypothetical protein [Terasakiella sp. SH-1]